MAVNGSEVNNKGKHILIKQINDELKLNCDSIRVCDDHSKLKSSDSYCVLSHANSTMDQYDGSCDGDDSSLLLLNNSQHSNSGEMSLMHDSSSDLQWCTEFNYGYECIRDGNLSITRSTPKSVFEGSLIDSEASDYITPPSTKYENISRTIDANLAEIDIETFRSEDINTVFRQGNEECESSPRSLSGGESFSLSYRSSYDGLSIYAKDEPLFSSKDSSLNCDKKERIQDKEVSSHKADAISVDSLDISFENNTSELLMKCIKQDTEKYTITFEESMIMSRELSKSEPKDDTSRVHRQSKNYGNNSNNNNSNMVKSEYAYTTWGDIKRDDRFNSNVNYNYSNISFNRVNCAKTSLSLPNIKSIVPNRMPYCPVSGFMPLYDLEGSQSSNSHSSSCEYSPPRSLFKMFIQNRISPFSSGLMSPSYNCDTPFGTPTVPIHNTIFENNNNTIPIENPIKKMTGDDTLEDMRLEMQKQMYIKLHASPIKELDECDSSSNDINMSSIDSNELKMNPQIVDKPILRQRNSRVNPINSNVSNESNNSNAVPQNPNEKIAFSGRMTTNIGKTTGISKETNSFSSGYMSSRMGSEWIRRTNPISHSKTQGSVSVTTTRTMATQIPVHIQDKEVQTNFSSDNSLKYVIREENRDNKLVEDVPLQSPQEHSQPLYVYYPNYSLPDLSFLHGIYESKDLPHAVYLSPTQHVMPKKENISVKLRQNGKRQKTRPKSYTDYETLSKQNFNHIKDWDSLNILLPNEFKELFKKLQETNANVPENTQIENDHIMLRNKEIRNNPYSNVKMRSHNVNSRHTDSVNHNESQCNYSHNIGGNTKRYSLQEPFPTYIPPSESCAINCGMSRSNTMPNCNYPYRCHQQCYHNCCHGCCHTPCHTPTNCLSPSSLIKMPFPPPASNDISSIDKLCQLLAMDLSFKKMMNVINRHNETPTKTSFPEPVAELNEESVLDANDSTMINEQINDVNAHNLLAHLKDRETNDGSNFKELRQRWESMTMTNPSVEKSNITLKKELNLHNNRDDTKKNTDGVVLRRPKILRKPSTEVRRPLSAAILRPTTLNTDGLNQRKSMIPIPKTGHVHSPINSRPVTHFSKLRPQLSK